jgi:ABC-type antimicrobial peptide transport system permease subunit
MAIVSIGLTLGVFGALGMSRWVASLLFGISPTDPWTAGGVVVLILTVALVACYVPARRATRVDPVVALRNE